MEQKIYASMKSIASYVPEICVHNDEFEHFLDTSNEWITKRTGIKTRYFAPNSQTSSDLGVEAAKIAIERANIPISDIDLVLCATLSPDYLSMPSNACLISHKLGIHNRAAFDISAACSGFVYLLSLAKAYIESRMYRNILVIGAEKVSSVLDFSDRRTCVLFGDGAGAAIVSATDNPKHAIIDVHINANGKYSNLLTTPRCVVNDTQNLGNLRENDTKEFLQMSGNEVFKLAIKTLANDVREILAKNQLTSNDISYFVPHQANLRIINAVGEMIDMDRAKIVTTVQKYGNTSAASIPMAINEIYENKKLQNGDLLLLDAFGGGLTWGSCLLYFNG